jgi:hypothetical protein
MKREKCRTVIFDVTTVRTGAARFPCARFLPNEPGFRAIRVPQVAPLAWAEIPCSSPFEDGSFDVVVSSLAIHNVPGAGQRAPSFPFSPLPPRE